MLFLPNIFFKIQFSEFEFLKKKHFRRCFWRFPKIFLIPTNFLDLLSKLTVFLDISSMLSVFSHIFLNLTLLTAIWLILTTFRDRLSAVLFFPQISSNLTVFLTLIQFQRFFLYLLYFNNFRVPGNLGFTFFGNPDK